MLGRDILELFRLHERSAFVPVDTRFRGYDGALFSEGFSPTLNTYDVLSCVDTLEYLNVIPGQVVIPAKVGIRKARSVENTVWSHPIGITQASLLDPI